MESFLEELISTQVAAVIERTLQDISPTDRPRMFNGVTLARLREALPTYIVHDFDVAAIVTRILGLKP
jgi:hypothetical protein